MSSKQTEALKLALEANIALRHWIQAIPADTVLPAMPGVDGDWLDGVDAAIREALAVQPAQPQQEPVAAECKFDREETWGRCSIEHHNLVQSEPERWPGYKTRLLYTSPQPAQQQKPVAIVASHPERIDWLRDEPPDGTLLYTTPLQRKPLTWQPSETAPQDGTPCLVYWGQAYGQPLIGIAARLVPYHGEMLWHGHGGSHNEVTHWMPLPAAPIEAAHGIKGDA